MPEPAFRRTPNPLPLAQLANAFLVYICGALSQLSILPFITQFVSEMSIIGGDKRKVGFYVGLLESLYNVSAAITVLHWSRLSDRIGRKPVLMMAMAAMVRALCRVYPVCLPVVMAMSVTSRCLLGLLDGSRSVFGSVLAELTDSTNRARGVTWSLVAWSAGGGIGALIGGSLANPGHHFPALFKGDFWKQYPYFLPCLVVGIIAIVSLLSVFLFFKETVEKSSLSSQDEHSMLLSADPDDIYSVQQLLARPPVVISIVNRMSLNFLFTCEGALVPVFFALPSEIGGLGLDPANIGYVLGGYRAFMVFFILTCSPWIIRRCGERISFIMAIFGCMSIWTVMPILNLCARSSGISLLVWAGVIYISLPLAIMETGIICSLIYIIAAAPTRRSLGTMNGIAFTLIATTEAVAPAIATSLFSLSVKHNLLGGYAVYAILFTISCFALLFARRLPDNTRPMWEEQCDDVDLVEDL